MDMIPVLSRIVARYASGALVAYGVIPHEVGADLAMDPDLALLIGAGIGILTEGCYALAVKFGWTQMTAWLSMLAVGFAALVATWLGGRMSGKSAAKVDKLKDEVKAHDRINKADTGDGLSDADRVKRLHNFNRRLGR